MISQGASTAALRRALAPQPAAAAAIGTFDYNGRTDRWIINEAARLAGVDESAAVECYRTSYVSLLREELATRDLEPFAGVVEVLAALEGLDDVTLAIGTGNGREGAFAKLESVGVAHHFDRGGFGDDHEDRVLILREAKEDAGWREGDRLVVIGDTEHDMTAAAAIGAVAVGVATGTRTTLEQLNDAGADVTLPDLADLDRSLTALLG